MSLRAGLLTDRITIKRANNSINEYGEEVEDWIDIYSTRARVTQTNSNKLTENDEIIMSYTREFFMRKYVPIQEYDRIVWKDKYYRVISLEKTSSYVKVMGELIND